ncbi:hypothetical protein OAT16_09420 [Prolixibacteraceae bacterium]|nr:hypothetical protein [Prolixibacteraceae bacterium]
MEKKSSRWMGVWVVVMSLFLFSCDYELTGESFVDIKIDQNDLPKLEIKRFEGKDTIILFLGNNPESKNTIEFTAFQDAYIDSVFIDDKLVLDRIYKKKNDDPQFPFLMRPYNPRYSLSWMKYSLGEHKLKHVVYYKSNSGSVSSNLGVELIGVKYQWVVNVFRNETEPFEVTTSHNAEGYLRVDWGRSDHPRFEYYLIDGLGHSHKFTNRDENYCVIKDYVGQGGMVTVKAITQGNYMAWKSVELPKETIELHFNKMDDGNLSFKYESLLYPDARYEFLADHMELQHSDGEVVTPPIFPSKSVHFSLRISSSGYYKHYLMGEKDVSFNYPQFVIKDGVTISEMINGGKYNLALIKTNKGLFLFDPNSRSIKSEDTYMSECQFASDMNGAKIAVYKNNVLRIYDSKDLRSSQDILFKSYSPADGHGAKMINDDVYVEKRGVLYNLYSLSQKKLIGTFQWNLTEWGKISLKTMLFNKDGSGFVACTDSGVFCFSKQKDVYELSAQYPNDGGYKIYSDFSNDSQIYGVNTRNKTVEIRNIADFSLVRQYSWPSNYNFEQIDRVKGQLILKHYSGRSCVYSIKEQKIISSFLNINRLNVTLLNNMLIGEDNTFMDFSINNN